MQQKTEKGFAVVVYFKGGTSNERFHFKSKEEAVKFTEQVMVTQTTRKENYLGDRITFSPKAVERIVMSGKEDYLTTVTYEGELKF